MKQEKHDINKLKWVRIFTPIHIPKYLVEQVRDREYTVEQFYQFQEMNCLIEEDGTKVLNPFNHLYVLVDEGNIVKGFLWAMVESLTNDLIINTFSMDKDYWNQGKAVKKAADHVKEILKKLKLRKVYWITNYPKHSERHGFKRSKSILMEYAEEQDGQNINGKHKGKGTGRTAEPATEAASPAVSGRTGSTSPGCVPAISGADVA